MKIKYVEYKILKIFFYVLNCYCYYYYYVLKFFRNEPENTGTEEGGPQKQ